MSTPEQPNPTESTSPRLLVIQVAMEEEAQPFLDAASTVGAPVHLGRAVHRELTLNSHRVVLVVSGIGMVNAADAAVSSAHHYGADRLTLVSAGTAGGLASGARVGDVVVGTSFLNVEADARAFGYQLGQVPGMPADYRPAQAPLEALAAVPGVTLATMASGEKFVTSELAQVLRSDFPDAWSVDMETAGVAQAAHNHGIAFAAVRAISDLCAPDSADFDAHLDGAAARSAAAVLAALDTLAA